MAEFCLECWNHLHHTKYGRYDVILSFGLELCEGCGEYKRVVLGRSNYFRDERRILMDLAIVLIRMIFDGIAYVIHKAFRHFRK